MASKFQAMRVLLFSAIQISSYAYSFNDNDSDFIILIHLSKTDTGQQPNRIKLKLDIVWVNLIKKLLHIPSLSF